METVVASKMSLINICQSAHIISQKASSEANFERWICMCWRYLWRGWLTSINEIIKTSKLSVKHSLHLNTAACSDLQKPSSVGLKYKGFNVWWWVHCAVVKYKYDVCEWEFVGLYAVRQWVEYIEMINEIVCVRWMVPPPPSLFIILFYFLFFFWK
jgi:hypothetical protein